MTINTITTTLPAAPDPNVDDRATFSVKAYNYTVAQKNLGAELQTIVPQMNTDIAAANTAAANAAASAQTAINAPGTNGTSASSMTIGTGSQSFVTQTGKAWVVGQFVVIASSASPTNWMAGTITAYTSGTGAMTVSVALTQGSGTTSSWAIGLCGPVGPSNAGHFVTAGTNTAYTLTPSPAITSYQAGQSWVVQFNAASGAAPTLTVSGVGTPPNLVKQAADGTITNIAAGDLPLNWRSRVTLLSATQALVERMPAAAITPLGVTAAASGTAVDITNIPATAKRITVLFHAVSFSTSGFMFVQLGDSGGIETTGYEGNSMNASGATIGNTNTTTAAQIYTNGATVFLNGAMTFTLHDPATNTWVWTGIGGTSGAMGVSAGRKPLSAALDRLRLSVSDGGAFDNAAGSVQIIVEA